jgi:hypothetical protein
VHAHVQVCTALDIPDHPGVHAPITREPTTFSIAAAAAAAADAATHGRRSTITDITTKLVPTTVLLDFVGRVRVAACSLRSCDAATLAHGGGRVACVVQLRAATERDAVCSAAARHAAAEHAARSAVEALNSRTPHQRSL